MNTVKIAACRARIYAFVGCMSGASHFTVAQLGIAWGGAAAVAGRELLEALVVA